MWFIKVPLFKVQARRSVRDLLAHFFPPDASPDRNSTTSPSCMM